MRIDRRYANILRWGFSYSLPDFGKSDHAQPNAADR